MNYRLTDKPKGYQWANFEKFSYVDWDYATRDWSGKMSPREQRIDIGRPRRTIDYNGEYRITFDFDDFGDMTKAEILKPRKMSAYEKEHRIQDAISLMIENGLIEKIA